MLIDSPDPNTIQEHAHFYVLNAFGAVHAGGGAPAINPATPNFGFDIAADIENVGADIGSVSSVREGTGRYLLTFERSPASCAWTTTLGVASNQATTAHAPMPGLGSARLALAAGPSFSQLRVSTMNASGTLTGQWFHVIVVCPRS